MQLMADPMVVLNSFQQALNAGYPVEQSELVAGYKTIYDEPNGGMRLSVVKIVDLEAQALAIFGHEDPIAGYECWNVGYAVSPKHRGRRLSQEAVETGLSELKKLLGRRGITQFYLEAVVDRQNFSSIQVANRLFSEPGVYIMERATNTPALHFKMLIG